MWRWKASSKNQEMIVSFIVKPCLHLHWQKDFPEIRIPVILIFCFLSFLFLNIRKKETSKHICICCLNQTFWLDFKIVDDVLCWPTPYLFFLQKFVAMCNSNFLLIQDFYSVGNKAKRGTWKRVFQENKFSEKQTFLTCAYQRVRIVRFSGNLACFVFMKHPFWGSPFCLITDDL